MERQDTAPPTSLHAQPPKTSTRRDETKSEEHIKGNILEWMNTVPAELPPLDSEMVVAPTAPYEDDHFNNVFSEGAPKEPMRTKFQHPHIAAARLVSAGLVVNRGSDRPFNLELAKAAQGLPTVNEGTSDDGQKRTKSARRRHRRKLCAASHGGIGLCCSPATYHALLHIPEKLELTVDELLLTPLIPNDKSLADRFKFVERVRDVVCEALRRADVVGELLFYLYGSVHLRTVLPDGDNDVTVIVNAANRTITSDGAHQLLKDIEKYARENVSGGIVVDKLVPSEIKVLKLLGTSVADGVMHVDLSINQRGGTATCTFLHHVDATFGSGHLFKRSLLLLKAWCAHEAKISGSEAGYLGSYTLAVMLMAMLNTLPRDIVQSGLPRPKNVQTEASPGDGAHTALTPLKVLLLFLEHYATFDFDEFAVGIWGPIRVSDIQASNQQNAQEGLLFATKQPNARNISKGAAAAHEFNKANGGVMFGRTKMFTDTTTGNYSTTPTPPTQSPRLTPRGKNDIQTDENSNGALPEASEPYTAGCISQEFVREMVRVSTEIDPSIASNQRGYYLRQGSEARVPPADSELVVNYFHVRLMNVRDPLRPYSNLCRGISYNHLTRIQSCFRRGATMIRERIYDSIFECKLKLKKDKTYVEFLEDVFPNSLAVVRRQSEPHELRPSDSRGEAPVACKNCKGTTPFCTVLENTNRPTFKVPLPDPSESRPPSAAPFQPPFQQPPFQQPQYQRRMEPDAGAPPYNPNQHAFIPHHHHQHHQNQHQHQHHQSHQHQHHHHMPHHVPNMHQPQQPVAPGGHYYPGPRDGAPNDTHDRPFQPRGRARGRGSYENNNMNNTYNNNTYGNRPQQPVNVQRGRGGRGMSGPGPLMDEKNYPELSSMKDH